MTILFVGNTPGDFGAPESANSLSATGRDAAYSPNAIDGFAASTLTINIPSTTGTYWFHMRYHPSFSGGTSGAGMGLIFRDALSRNIAAILRNTNATTIFVQAYGSTTVSGANYTLTSGTTVTLDIKLTVGASGGSIVIELYANGVLVSSATATNSGTVKTQPTSIFYSNVALTGNNVTYLSEVIVAVDESTIGARLASLVPTSAGFYATMSGTVAGLADYDPLTGVVADAAAERFNAVMSAYAGIASPTTIRGVYLKSHATQNGAAPTRLAHSLRLSGTDYNATPVTVISGESIMTEWASNPATAAPWTTAALAALEGGLLSAA